MDIDSKDFHVFCTPCSKQPSSKKSLDLYTSNNKIELNFEILLMMFQLNFERDMA